MNLLNTLLAPHLTEKSALLMENNSCYVFKVRRDATKDKVKKAIESAFNVQVKKVAILNQKGKSRTFRGVQGKEKDFKKAYVTLESGNKINFEELLA